MIKQLDIKNFRNHSKYQINFDKNITYIVGENGTGKTSILESIYFAATTKSHRTSNEKEMIKINQFFSVIKLKTKHNEYHLILSEKGKRVSINQIEKKRLSDYIGQLNVVMFSPEDANLIKGSPGVRRQFLDLEISQIDFNYLKLLTQYKKILKQRNALLKQIKINDDYTFLNILGEQLFEVGEKIMDIRKKFIEELNEEFKKAYHLFSNHQAEIKYLPNIEKDKYLLHFKQKQKVDIYQQTTSVGIHKDDFIINFNQEKAFNFASQGQQRLIVISLKLALLKLIKRKTKKEVILLLDDVLSELDETIQKKLLEELPDDEQIIISSAVNINESKNIQIIRLSKGDDIDVKGI